MLRSFEAVMQHIEQSPDYIHPDLVPQAVVGSREYHRPAAEDNPLNAWSHQCHLRAARPTSDLLRGRTVAIKDNIAVGGLPTTLGTQPEILGRDDGAWPVSPVDATVVARLLAAGAVIKGTATCENFCASPLSFTSATGPVHHPLLPGYTAGGSSSGACALVAAGVLRAAGRPPVVRGDTVQLAVGGDQAGSVRNPACYTGLYGLKPTFGLVPYTGAASMTPMIDHLGPIAASLEDIALLLKVMAGYDGIDPRMTPESPLVTQVPDYIGELAAHRASLSEKTRGQPTRAAKTRVGLLTESFSVDGLAAEVRDLVRQGTRKYFEAAGAEVVDISVPMHAEAPLLWTAATRPSMSQWLCQGRPAGELAYLAPHVAPRWPPGQAAYEQLTASNPALVNIQLSGQWAGCGVAPALEAKAHRKIFELRAAYDAALAAVDVLVTPCAPTVAMPHPPPASVAPILDRLRPAVGLTSNTCPFNVTGHPALSVPCGALPGPGHPDVPLPVGLQLVARRWDDMALLKAAALFEEGRRRLDA